MKYYRLQLIPITRIHVGMGMDIGPMEYTIANKLARYFNIQNLSRVLVKQQGESWLQVLKSENVVTIRRYIHEHFPLDSVPCSSVWISKTFTKHFNGIS